MGPFIRLPLPRSLAPQEAPCGARPRPALARATC